ncbi:MAG: hypothetical protein AAF611_09435 [Bacteroidota bacterium]
MKKFLKFSFILALAVFTFSCSNDNTDVIPEDPQNNNEVNAAIKTNFSRYANNAIATNQAQSIFENNEENSDAVGNYSQAQCFTINFPITLTDGNQEVVANSQQEADSFGDLGYFLAFPVTVTVMDGTAMGTTVTIANEFEFVELLEDCFGEEIISFGDDCFTFNFPLSVVTDNGNTVVVNDELELFTVPNAVGFSYPISVTTQTATGAVVVTINSDAEFDDLYNDCFGIDPCEDCGVNCFEIVYPITLVQEDGTVVTVNDDEEFITFLSGLDNDDYFVPTYPMNIQYEDGTQATINSDAELEAAFDACDD